MKSRELFYSLFLLVVCSLPAFAQTKAKAPMKGSAAHKARNVGCSSGEFSFKCPKGYKVLFPGNSNDRLFFAKNNEFRFGVFVVYEPTESSLTELLPKIVPALVRRPLKSLEWKDVEVDSRPSSKYEASSIRRIGIDARPSVYLTLEFREIHLDGKRLLAGTLVDGYEGPVGVRESFEKGAYTTNAGCFDSVDIIAAFTREKPDPEKGPCFFEITVKMDT